MLRRIVFIPMLQHRTYVETVNIRNTVDTSEMVLFNKLIHEWWHLGGPTKPLHTMNKLRIPFVRDGLISAGAVKVENIDTPKPLKDLAILDIGCGGGILTEPLCRLGSKVTGLDASSQLIEVAKAHAQLDKNLIDLNYVSSTIEEHAEKNTEKYDAIIASEVVEHVTHKDIFIEACVKCLKPGGSVFFTTLNKTLTCYFGAVVMGEYILNIIPKGTHEYDKLIAPHHLQRFLEDQNCKTRLIHGMFYNVINNGWSWTSDHSISYALHAIKVSDGHTKLLQPNSFFNA